MKYYNIKNQLKSLVTFSIQDIYLVDADFRQATLYDWEKAGKVVKLKNNCYIFSDFKPQDLDYYLLSNQLYKPSYVSMELALNHYNLIPEGVSLVTAISTDKTQSFITPIATFRYQSVRPELFFGYNLIQHKNHRVQLASLEKAILDYLYLHSKISSTADFKTLRWNRDELNHNLDQSKLEKYLAIFNNQSLNHRVAMLQNYLKEKNA